MPNKPVSPITLDDIVRRARSVIGEGKYFLGKGGRVPSADSPFDAGECDCSGFVSWCIGVDRYQPYDREGIRGDYVETTAIVEDALKEHRLFIAMNERRPGYIIVYGDRTTQKAVNGQVTKVHHEGHVGIISEVDSNSVVKKVIHCSMGNQRTLNVAVAETTPEVFFARNWITVKFKGVVSS